MEDESLYYEENLVDYNTKVNIICGICATVSLNLVNPYFAKFAERLGATDYQIGLLTSLPYFVSIFAFIPGAILIESNSNKKKVTGTIMLIHKFFYLLLACVPFFNNVNRASLFVILIGLMNLPGSIGTMGYQSSIGDIFLPRDRGISMGLRNRYATIFSMIVTFLSGQILTKIPKTNNEAIILYQIFFVIAFIISLGEVISYFKFKGMKKGKDINCKYIDSLKEILRKVPKEKDFIIFTLCSVFFYIGWIGAQPLFSIYSIKVLKANEIGISAIAIASSLSSIIAYTKWAKFADKKGNSFALSIAILGMGITPILYTLSNTIKQLVLFNVIVGVSVAGTNLILFNILLEVTPKENRTVYIAIYNTFIAIISAIAPMIGITIKEATNIKTALVVVGLLRITASVFFFLRDKYSKT